MHIWTCFLLLQQDKPMPLRIEEEEEEQDQEKADEEEEEDGEEEEKMSIQSSAQLIDEEDMSGSAVCV